MRAKTPCRVRVHQTWGPGREDAELGGESMTDSKGKGSGVPPAFSQSLMHPSGNSVLGEETLELSVS